MTSLRDRINAATEQAVAAEAKRLLAEVTASMAASAAVYHLTDRPPWNYSDKADRA